MPIESVLFAFNQIHNARQIRLIDRQLLNYIVLLNFLHQMQPRHFTPAQPMQPVRHNALYREGGAHNAIHFLGQRRASPSLAQPSPLARNGGIVQRRISAQDIAQLPLQPKNTCPITVELPASLQHGPISDPISLDEITSQTEAVVLMRNGKGSNVYTPVTLESFENLLISKGKIDSKKNVTFTHPLTRAELNLDDIQVVTGAALAERFPMQFDMPAKAATFSR